MYRLTCNFEKGKVNKLTGSARKINKSCGGRRKIERRVSPGEIKSQSLVVVVKVVVLALLQEKNQKRFPCSVLLLVQSSSLQTRAPGCSAEQVVLCELLR